MLSSFSVRALKEGRKTATKINAKTKAKKAMSRDSLKNCPMSCFRLEPMALRTPTSLARFSERAVLKFIKLMQAITKMNRPKMPNSRTYLMNPPVFFPFSNSPNKRHFDIGCRKTAGLMAFCINLSSLTWFSTTSLILASVFSGLRPSLSCTYT